MFRLLPGLFVVALLGVGCAHHAPPVVRPAGPMGPPIRAHVLLAGGPLVCVDGGAAFTCWDDVLSSPNDMSREDAEASLVEMAESETLEAPIDGARMTVSDMLGGGCAIVHDGGVYCWGDNSEGATGRAQDIDCLRALEGIATAQPDVLDPDVCGQEPEPVDEVRAAVDLVHSLEVTCALEADGLVQCWGRRIRTGHGINHGVSASLPAYVSGLTQIVELAANDALVCALRADGAVFCWGNLGFYTIGLPERLDVLPPARAIAVGDNVCALGQDDQIHCVLPSAGPFSEEGLERLAQHDDAHEAEDEVPLRFRSARLPRAAELDLGHPKKVVTALLHSCALGDDGAVRCWGDDSQGQISGQPTAQVLPPTPAPIALDSANAAIDVAVSDTASCVLLANGDLRCWGSLLGARPDPIERPSAAQTAPRTVLDHVKRVVMRDELLCAIGGVDGTLRCQGAVMDRSLRTPFLPLGLTTPMVLPTNTRPVDVAIGTAHVCVRDDAGNVFCAGDHSRGQLGIGTAAVTANLTRVESITHANAIVAWDDSTCAVLSDHRVACWGGSADFVPRFDPALCGSPTLLAELAQRARHRAYWETEVAVLPVQIAAGAPPRSIATDTGIGAATDDSYTRAYTGTDGSLCALGATAVKCWFSAPPPPADDVARSTCTNAATAGDVTPRYPAQDVAYVRMYNASIDTSRMVTSLTAACEDETISGGGSCADEAKRGRKLDAEEARTLIRLLNEAGPATPAPQTDFTLMPRHELTFFDRDQRVIARLMIDLGSGATLADPPIPLAAQRRFAIAPLTAFLIPICERLQLRACRGSAE